MHTIVLYRVQYQNCFIFLNAKWKKRASITSFSRKNCRHVYNRESLQSLGKFSYMWETCDQCSFRMQHQNNQFIQTITCCTSIFSKKNIVRCCTLVGMLKYSVPLLFSLLHYIYSHFALSNRMNVFSIKSFATKCIISVLRLHTNFRCLKNWSILILLSVYSMWKNIGESHVYRFHFGPSYEK